MNVLIRAHLEAGTGYGQHVEHTARQLERHGHRVRFQALNQGRRLPQFFADRLTDGEKSDQVIQISPPFSPCPPGAIYCTTWESDVFPAVCVAHLAPARLVITNSRFIAQAFVRSGVHAPVHVVPLGVCPAEYHPIHEPPIECRFGLVANLTHSPHRKNIQGAIDAFRLAFANDPDVSLTIKINRLDTFDHPGDPGITLIKGTFSTERMRWFYNSLTCLVSASMAEGFGLCPLQAMACGRPAIATTYGGHTEYLDPTVGYPVGYELVQPDWYEGGGNLALPSVPSMASQMRAVYEDRSSAIAQGAAALRRARAFSWDRYGDRLVELIGSTASTQ